ncbi:transposase [Streptomyces microflavus]|uniref:transposase n=1 Tax=Streptomyces microflavus TaxID=1919 RepID=UPI00379F3F8B
MPRRRCYPSDAFDDEWSLIEPLLPVPACDTPTCGRPEKHPRREIVDAIRYVVDTGRKWRALPRDFPRGARVTGSWPAGQGTASSDRSVTSSANASAARWDARPGRSPP